MRRDTPLGFRGYPASRKPQRLLSSDMSGLLARNWRYPGVAAAHGADGGEEGGGGAMVVIGVMDGNNPTRGWKFRVRAGLSRASRIRFALTPVS